MLQGCLILDEWLEFVPVIQNVQGASVVEEVTKRPLHSIKLLGK